MNNPFEGVRFIEWWNTLNTSFISIYFVVFLLVILLIYWLMPRKVRWIVLLFGSLLFYSIFGIKPLIMVVLSSWVTWSCGFALEKLSTSKKRSRKCLLIAGIITSLSILIYCKVYSLFDLKYGFIIPLGVSYYTFSSISYLADIYWKKDEAEENYFRFLLFVLFFPKILEGPISRHRIIGRQLRCTHRFDYEQFCFGVQRILWGYFKKMVIADRFLVVSSTIFENYKNYQGQFFIVGALASAIQIYCDFSGCMDIALGVSECFGITLEENFRRPFFSSGVGEFWRRWHITLGAWFKDYVYMPIAISPRLLRITKWVKNHLGVRCSKSFVTIVPLTIVWILTGFWHGTGIDYLAWGCYWGSLIIISSVFNPEISLLCKKMRLPINSIGWKKMQIVRTFLLFCLGRLITVCGTGNLDGCFYAIKSLLSHMNIWIWFDKSLYNLGLDMMDFWIGIVGVALLWMVECKQEKGIKIRETLSTKPYYLRLIIYICAVLAILVFGMYGPGFGYSSFVYMKY